MLYGLVHNDSVKVGPRTWLFSSFKKYLDENGLGSENLPRLEPKNITVINGANWKILPAYLETVPCHPIFQQLAGPFFTIEPTKIIGTYQVTDESLSIIKMKLKDIVTVTRFKVETREINYTFDDGDVVGLYTSREDRNTYLDAYHVIPDGSTVTFKFKNSKFKTITKEELLKIVQTITLNVQESFNWEGQLHKQIEESTTIDELKAIDIKHPME